MKRLSFFSIIFISITIVFYGFFLLVLKNLSYYLKLLEERVEIVAFLDDDLTENQRNQLIKKVKDIKSVEQIKYTSKEEALKEFKKNEEFAKQIKILGENPLPATIDIYLSRKNPKTVKNTAKEIELLDGIEDVYYTSAEAENLLTINKVFSTLSIWGNTIFMLFTVLLLIIVSFSIKTKKIIYGIFDAIIGGGIGIYILNLIYKSVFIPNFKNPMFLTKTEIILISFVLIIIGLIVRIPRNVISK
ncbi:MAG: hypothetical protein JW983_01190 [Elusimicrobia bacterium]|nr:hypothetical protein [Elusimicrobiota bacterium]